MFLSCKIQESLQQQQLQNISLKRQQLKYAKMDAKQEPLTKQQLFVNPITILEKQKRPSQQIQSNLNDQVPSIQFQIPNFNEIFFQALQPDNDFTSNKTKQIQKKSIPTLSSSTQNNKQKNYRTRMCPEGRQCRKRLVCTFAHNQYQLRRPYRNRKNPCKRYQKGLCSLGAACPDYHGNMDLKKKNYKYKTHKCSEWLEKGTCGKGKLCIFIHDQNQEEDLEGGESMEQQQNGQVNPQQVELSQQNVQETEIQQNKKQVIQESERKTLQVRDIFSQKPQNRRAIVVTEVIQEKIESKDPKEQINQNAEDFNIQFNF